MRRHVLVNRSALLALIKLDGRGVREISRRTGLSRNTLKEVLQAGSAYGSTTEKLSAYFGVEETELLLAEKPKRPEYQKVLRCQADTRRLWQLIGATDLSLMAISKGAGMTDNTLRNVLKGKRVNPPTIKKLSEYFGVRMGDLILYED